MSISAKELKQWINSLPNNSHVGIDDGGLTLQIIDNPEIYLEIGGLPENDNNATTYCPACETEVKDDAFNRTSLADHGKCVDCQKEYMDVGDKNYPRSDWQYEVSNNDTTLGYDEWVGHKHESDEGSTI